MDPSCQVVVAFTVKWCALCRGYEAEFSRAAAAFDGLVDAKRSRAPLVFARVDVDDNRALAKSFGVTSVPFVAVMKHKRWYTVKAGETVIRAPKRYNGYLGAAPTVEWINRETGMHAEIRPYVTELTGDTVDAFVNDTNHDVLVEFYASWCGHCKQFAPFFYEVGAHFAADERVRVAKLDVDVHRDAAARYNVTGLPSLQLFPRGYKSRGLHFKGAERKPAAIIAFVKSPQVYLVEAQITDMPEWECVVWLEAKGVLRKGSVTDAVGLMGTPVASGAGKGESGAEDDDEGGEEEEDEKERVARGGGVGGGAGRFTGKVRYRANHANSTAHDQVRGTRVCLETDDLIPPFDERMREMCGCVSRCDAHVVASAPLREGSAGDVCGGASMGWAAAVVRDDGGVDLPVSHQAFAAHRHRLLPRDVELPGQRQAPRRGPVRRGGRGVGDGCRRGS